MIKKLTHKGNKISGDLTGIRGNISECEITGEDRKKGIDIIELIA